MKHGFPLRLLRLLIGVHRLLLVENVATKVVRSGGSAVVAGCVHATTLMKLALVDSVDHTLKKLLSLQWWWRTRSSRRSARATKCRNSFKRSTGHAEEIEQSGPGSR